MDELSKANLYVERAENKMKGKSCGCFGDSISTRTENAIKLYEEASVIYNREKKYGEAAKCKEQMAFLKDRIGENSEREWEDAAHLYSFVDKNKTVEVLKNSVLKYEKIGDHYKAANNYERIAQYFEEEKDYKLSVMFYEKSADSFSLSRDHRIKERNARLKYLDLSCINELGEWKSHVDVYESIGKQYLLDSLSKYSAKEMFFKIVILYLLYDVRYF
jgi:alpha-soluble NSF attachment protein